MPGVIKKSVKVHVSFLEIYNESVNDLLDSAKKNLEIREDKINKQIVVENLSRVEVKSAAAIIELLKKGNENRKVACTKMNSKSSRSHSVFTIHVQMSEKNTQTARNIIKSSVINLVDLAGSEGVGKMHCQGLWMQEGNNINKSLLALSNVIYKLGQRWQVGAKTNSYVNFRDSKLTRILQQSLQGNSQTAIICTVNQLKSNYHETQKTLYFGQKAKTIRTLVNINEIVQEAPYEIATKMAKMTKEIESLKAELDERNGQLEQYRSETGQFQSVGHLKAHIEYLSELLDQKNREFLELNQ